MPNQTVRKFLDWRGYFEGMYVHAVKALTGAALAFTGTNTAEACAPTALHGMGLTVSQAAVTGASVLFIEVMRYINAKPLPDVIERPVTAPPFPTPIDPPSTP